MVEKLTELNVNKIYIGKTENTQNTKVDTLKIHNWAISALEQSGTPFFPKIQVTEIIDYSIFDTCFDITGHVLKKDSPKVHTFAIGPEGGWSPEELTNFKFKYKLSDFSLRTDTAAISAVSLMM
jgi:RsmE family RNA methyltransferase